MTERPRVLVIAGPTGSGKSGLALDVATRLPAEIIGCDSVQLFQKFDIGSAKPNADERSLVPHHMIDIMPPDSDFDAAKFGDMAMAACRDVLSRGRLPIVVGGSGLYLRTLIGADWHTDLPADEHVRAALKERETVDLYAELQGRDPERAAELHLNDRLRIVRALELLILLGRPLRELPKNPPPVDATVILLMPERHDLHARIARRTDAMLQAGLISEVEGLLASGVSRLAKPMLSIGYKEVVDFLMGDLTREQLSEAINASTRQYAKRQSTWFRKVPAHLTLTSPDVERSLALARQVLPLSGMA